MSTSLLRHLWVAPVSVPAAGIALLARLAGGALEVREGVLEAYGGFLPVLLGRVYPPMPIAAITLGHVVLARTRVELEQTRTHERIHVRQYERWGPLFPLVYLGASLVALLQGRHAYDDNVFEREACRLS
jgi:hypothetical protein